MTAFGMVGGWWTGSEEPPSVVDKRSLGILMVGNWIQLNFDGNRDFVVKHVHNSVGRG
jgi:hypothetical protein